MKIKFIRSYKQHFTPTIYSSNNIIKYVACEKKYNIIVLIENKHFQKC